MLDATEDLLTCTTLPVKSPQPDSNVTQITVSIPKKRPNELDGMLHEAKLYRARNEIAPCNRIKNMELRVEW